MAEDVILVLDAGTGGGRVVAVDRAGKVRARSYRAWSYIEPAGIEMYAREFDPHEFLSMMAECCRQVVAEVGAGSVKGVTTTGMRQGCVFLDADGEPLYGGPNRDVRGIIYTDEVEEILGKERAQKITGRWPPWMFVPSRLYWFREDAPDVAGKIAKVLMINDWLVHWLSGRAFSEPTNAAESMLFDVSSGAWSPEMMEAAGVKPDLVPEIRPCGQVVGEVTEKAARETGVPRGTPVITGMADTQAGLLAGGVRTPGDVGIVAGSTAPVMMVMDQPKMDPEMKLWTGCHPLPGLWVAESNSGDAGLSYRGYVEGHLGLMVDDRDCLYEKVEELADDAGVGAMGARAFLGPVIWDLLNMTPSARGGLFFSYPLGEENAGPGVVARAILENIGFALRANLSQAAGMAGEPGTVVIAGGMTRNGLFCRVVSSVLGRVLRVVKEPEATALGCAMAGFSALGVYPGMEEAHQEVMGASPWLMEVVEPDEDDADDYNDLYEEWLERYPVMMGQED